MTKMKKLNQYGFAAIEALLILAIVGIIGGAGYFVFKSKDNANKAYDNSVNTGEPSKNIVDSFEKCVKAGNPIIKGLRQTCKLRSGKTFKNPDIYAGWKTYNFEKLKFSIKVPAGWKDHKEVISANSSYRWLIDVVAAVSQDWVPAPEGYYDFANKGYYLQVYIGDIDQRECDLGYQCSYEDDLAFLKKLKREMPFGDFTQKIITVDDKKVVFSNASNGESTFVSANIYRDEKEFRISLYPGNDPQNSTHMKLFELILKSIKLT